MVISRRVTSTRPRSESSRIARETVSREEPIIWAMVWWVSFRVIFGPPLELPGEAVPRSQRGPMVSERLIQAFDVLLASLAEDR